MIEDFFEGVMNSEFLNSFFMLILNVLIMIVNVLFLPFDILIHQFMPGIDEALSKIPEMFNIVGSYVGYVINAMAIPPIVLSLVILYFSFVIGISLASWSSKLVLKWITALK